MTESNVQPAKVWLTVEEAAAYTGLSVNTLNRMRVDGSGALFSKAGRRVLYWVRDLDAWLLERRRASTSEILDIDETGGR